MPTTGTKVLAPGARVVVRDEEWLVRSVRQSTFGGIAVHVTGTSELVRGKESIFLSDLDDIQELRPEETQLVHDTSPRYRRSRLYLESLLRRTPPTDNALCIGHRAAIDPSTYQLQPAAKALGQPRPRILMADGVGLGKTIEVGILLAELIRRGRGDRILVVALKSILAQFQQELWARFSIPLVRLDSVGLQRVQTRIPSNMNPFYYYNRVIISIDTLKKDAKYRRYLEQCRWDAVVVDECQNVAIRVRGEDAQESQRARLAQLLSRTADALILTSATPHDGRPESFASLMKLLEPTAIANEQNYTRDEIEGLFLRRFKKDIAHEVEGAFKERKPLLIKEDASNEENAAFEDLSRVEFRTIDRMRDNKGILFRTLLLKSFLSSPAACIATIDQRLKHDALQKEEDPRAAHDRQALRDLRVFVDRVKVGNFSKYQRLLTLLRGIGLDRPGNEERVVIFSERIDTLEFLHEHLVKDLELKREQIEVFHGTLDDQEQKRLVQQFGTRSTPMRILLGSDAASEGINLHYFCHRMVHFDLPWSLITLEQRNGRVDRFGQKQQPEIFYLLTIPGEPKLRGDLRILERLIEKENQAHKNLGDVAWLLNLHEAELEEEHIGRGLEGGEAPEDVIPEEPKHTDLMDLLFGDDAPKEAAPVISEPVALYADDLAYAREAFEEVLGKESKEIEWHDHLRGLTLQVPEDLARQFKYLPEEMQTGNGELKLTIDRKQVMEALEKAREKEDRWPEWQLFWGLHPVAEWLNNGVLARFDRHEAPVIRVSQGLAPKETVFVFQGIISNHRSQPVLADWFGLGYRGDQPGSVHPLRELLAATKLGKSPPNVGGDLNAAALAALRLLLPRAVGRAREHMMRVRQQRSEVLSGPLREGLRKLTRWRDKALSHLQETRQGLLFDGLNLRADHARRLEMRRNEIEKTYEERKRWIDEGMRTVDEPHLRVAVVLIGQAG